MSGPVLPVLGNSKPTIAHARLLRLQANYHGLTPGGFRAAKMRVTLGIDGGALATAPALGYPDASLQRPGWRMASMQTTLLADGVNATTRLTEV